MGRGVYANGNDVACKAGDGKVIAAFPDVCMSPPSPPAGPLPVPYPASSFSRDMASGSRSVTIGGKEVMLKDQSFYKSSPLGDEAATRSFGANLVTHAITGKTYFAGWSMDVKFEGLNVCRHLDPTTSNHASYPGGTGPMSELEGMALAALSDPKEDLCPCCWSPDCTAALPKEVSTASGPQPREPFSFDEWYGFDPLTPVGAARRAELAGLPCAGGGCPNHGKPARKSDAPCDVYRVTTTAEGDTNASAGPSEETMERIRSAARVPRSPRELARSVHGPFAKAGDIFVHPDPAKGRVWTMAERNAKLQIDHRTPRVSGGCPSSPANLVAHDALCANCQRADQLLDSWNGAEQVARRAAMGVS